MIRAADRKSAAFFIHSETAACKRQPWRPSPLHAARDAADQDRACRRSICTASRCGSRRRRWHGIHTRDVVRESRHADRRATAAHRTTGIFPTSVLSSVCSSVTPIVAAFLNAATVELALIPAALPATHLRLFLEACHGATIAVAGTTQIVVVLITIFLEPTRHVALRLMAAKCFRSHRDLHRRASPARSWSSSARSSGGLIPSFYARVTIPFPSATAKSHKIVAVLALQRFIFLRVRRARRHAFLQGCKATAHQSAEADAVHFTVAHFPPRSKAYRVARSMISSISTMNPA